jgi:Ribonuclease G/E
VEAIFVTTRVLADCSPGEFRVAALRDGVLLDYAIGRPGAPDLVGDVYRGRVTARVPAMAGAFVALPGADGFLPDSEGADRVTEGDVLAVRVTRAPQGGKGPRLSARLPEADAALLGNGPPALLRRGAGAVERLAALHPYAPVLIDDRAALAALRPVLADRTTWTAKAFDDDVEAQIEALASPEVVLHDGSRLSIHPTPALVAIDVDAGTTTGERRGKTAAQSALNRAVLPALARQIRLRNLSGAILVDFAGLSPRRRAARGPALEALLAEDPLRPRLLGFTALGLAEIVRPRIHPPLHESLLGPHAAGLAALRAIAAGLAAEPGRLPALRAAPAVVAALQADPVALPDLARLAGRALMVRSDPGLSGANWMIEHD